MVANRFQGVLATRPERNEAQIYGLYASQINSTKVEAPLLINGTGSAALARITPLLLPLVVILL